MRCFIYLILFLFPILGFSQVVNLETSLSNVGFSKNSTGARSFGRWQKQNFSLEAQDKCAYLTLNGSRIFLRNTISATNKKFFIKKADWDETIFPILSPRALRKSVVTIVLDPGHGGSDPGMQNKSMNMLEKVYVLDIAKRVEKHLKARNFKVYLTRTRDVALSLEDRSRFANTKRADVFVSIHFNAAAAKSARGIETFTLTKIGTSSTHDTSRTLKKEETSGNKFDDYNILLAYKIHSATVSKTDTEDRGLKSANFAVLKDLNCPGILIECGFLTNSTEAVLVRNSAYREKIAQGIAIGIINYARAVNPR